MKKLLVAAISGLLSISPVLSQLPTDNNLEGKNPISITSAWNLPASITPKNTTIKFNLDTTWHMVKGKVGQIKGQIKLGDTSDVTSVTIDAAIPVSSLNTNNSWRDERMLEVLESTKFPEIKIHAQQLRLKCTPEKVQNDAQHRCRDKLNGRLTIKDVTQDITLPIIISLEDGHYVISGQLPIMWKTYGIEDPSIMIATVYDTVKVKFRVVI